MSDRVASAPRTGSVLGAQSRTMHVALVWVVLSVWGIGCTTGEFYRECDTNADCSSGLVCSFSSCVSPEVAGLVDTGGDADASVEPDADVGLDTDSALPDVEPDVEPDAEPDALDADTSVSDTDSGDDADTGDDVDADAPCVPSAEVCDGIDNDCDGDVDEDGAELLSVCAPGAGATVASCDAGACVYACEGALVDVNGDLNDGADGDGCECTPTPELCDGFDNNCDGQIDEDDPDLLTVCAPSPQGAAVGCEGGSCAYACEGVLVDANGDLSEGVEGDGCECEPSGVDVCDGVDNDCDGAIDQDNPELLSVCEERPDFAVDSCSGGACVYICLPRDVPDRCDGIDADCDGEIDENLALCPLQSGVCVGSTEPCIGGVSLPCQTQTYERHSALFQEDVETLCDGEDNNCDGATDELCCTVIGAFQPYGADAPEFGWVNYQVMYAPERDIYGFVGARRDAEGSRTGELVVGRLDNRGRVIGALTPIGANTVGPLALALVNDQFLAVWSDGEAEDLRVRLFSAQTGSLGPERSVALDEGETVLEGWTSLKALALEGDQVVVAAAMRSETDQGTRFYPKLRVIDALTGGVEAERELSVSMAPGSFTLSVLSDLVIYPLTFEGMTVSTFALSFLGIEVTDNGGGSFAFDAFNRIEAFEFDLTQVLLWGVGQPVNSTSFDDLDTDLGFQLVPDDEGMLVFYNARSAPDANPAVYMQRLDALFFPSGDPVLVRQLDRRPNLLYEAKRLPSGKIALGYAWGFNFDFSASLETQAFVQIFDPELGESEEIRVQGDAGFETYLLQLVEHPYGLLSFSADSPELTATPPESRAVLLNAELDELCLPENP